jgi:hypothetical protein
MKAIDKVNELVSQNGPEPSTLEQLVVFAYYMGREEATKRICDEHNRRIKVMRDRANAMRYYKLASSVIGAEGSMIYSSDYAGDVISTFGNDEVDFE